MLQCPDTVVLIYVGKLPDFHQVRARGLWRLQVRFKQRCLRQFGTLPFQEQRFAHVRVTRVLGARERLMDEDKNLQLACGGAIDALVSGGYLRDDSPADAIFEFHQDPARRAMGPRLEIHISYAPG